jgi:hypothetical protein
MAAKMAGGARSQAYCILNTPVIYFYCIEEIQNRLVGTADGMAIQ